MATGHELIKQLPVNIRKSVVINMQKQDKLHRLKFNYRSLSGIIETAFTWTETSQGREFWKQLSIKLQSYEW